MGGKERARRGAERGTHILSTLSPFALSPRSVPLCRARASTSAHGSRSPSAFALSLVLLAR